ncbi:MAG: M56 family metallopeptidase [Planctomycetota bacterium]
MESWVSTMVDGLWQNALAVVPIGLLVALACRFIPSRPATRHTLWVTVLLLLVLPVLLPKAPRVEGMAQPVVTVDTDLNRPLPPSTKKFGDKSLGEEASPSVEDRLAVWPRKVIPAPSIETPLPIELEHRKANREPSSGKKKSLKPNREFDAKAKEDTAKVDAKVRKRAKTAPPRENNPSPPDESSALCSLPTLSANQTLETPAPQSARPDDLQRDLDQKVEPLVAATSWLQSLSEVRESVLKVPAIPREIWLAGTTLLALFAGAKCFRFRRLLARATPASEPVVAMVRETAKQMGLRKVPESLCVDARVSPMIWCGRRPRLVLPIALWRELDDQGRRAILCHELAHLRRRDHWVCWLEAIAGCLYWWHPLVWWVRGRVQEEADMACDAWVTWIMPRERRAYAAALLTTKKYVSEPDAAVPAVGIGAITGKTRRFARRLTMVMTNGIRPRLSMAGTGMAVLLACAGWWTAPVQSCEPEAKVKAANCPPCPPCAPGCDAKHEHSDHAQAHALKALKAPRPPKAPRAHGGPGSTPPAAPFPPMAPMPPMSAMSPMPAMPPVPPAPPAPPARGAWSGSAVTIPGGDSGSTFHEYLRTRDAFATAKDSSGQGQGHAHASTNLFGQTSPEGVGGLSVAQERLAKLEAELARLQASLDGMRESLQALDGHGKVKDGARVGARNNAKQEREKTKRARKNDEKRRTEANGKIEREYQLKEGKLQALIELMSRPDVPILIRPIDGGISVQATRGQHRVFGAFVRMLDGAAPRAEADGDASEEVYALAVGEHGVDLGDIEVELAEELANAEVDENGDDDDDDDEEEDEDDSSSSVRDLYESLVERMPESLRDGVRSAVEHSYEALTGVLARNGGDHAPVSHEERIAIGELLRSLEIQAAQFDSRRSMTEDQVRTHDERARHLEKQADTLSESMDRISSSADRLSDEARVQIEMQLSQMQMQSQISRDQAVVMQQRAEELSGQAEALAESVEALREAAQNLRERAMNFQGAQ